MNQMVAFDRKTEKMETVKSPTSGSVVRNVSVDAQRKIIWLAEGGVRPWKVGGRRTVDTGCS
jgi:hypothetical protein